jgi:hypothetical protein
VDDHFPERPPRTAGESFTHHRVNFELVLDGPASNECSASAVAVSIWARAEDVRAEAGPTWIELNLTNGSGKGNDLWIDLTPAQAREVGMKLVNYARAAEAGTQHKPLRQLFGHRKTSTRMPPRQARPTTIQVT